MTKKQEIKSFHRKPRVMMFWSEEERLRLNSSIKSQVTIFPRDILIIKLNMAMNTKEWNYIINTNTRTQKMLRPVKICIRKQINHPNQRSRN